jgi:hypothetical protein
MARRRRIREQAGACSNAVDKNPELGKARFTAPLEALRERAR